MNKPDTDAIGLAQMILDMDAAAKAEGLYVGGGYNPRLTDEQQEGPMWKRIMRTARALQSQPAPDSVAGKVSDALTTVIDTLERVIKDIKPGVLASQPVKEILETAVIRIDAARSKIQSQPAPVADGMPEEIMLSATKDSFTEHFIGHLKGFTRYIRADLTQRGGV